MSKYTLQEPTKNSPTQYTVQWPQFYLEECSGPESVRWIGTTHCGEDEYTSKIFVSQEACYQELEAKVSPITAYLKTSILLNFSWITALAGYVPGPSVGSVVFVGICAIVFCAFKFSWYFNDSEKQAIPAALKKYAKEALIVGIIVLLATGIGLLIVWLLEKIGSFFAR